MARYEWNDDNSKKLLVILVEEKDRGVSKFIWSNIANVFNAQTSGGKEENKVTGKQVNNRYGDLKNMFKAWEELQKMSGIAINPYTKSVDVEEKSLERWKSYLVVCFFLYQLSFIHYSFV